MRGTWLVAVAILAAGCVNLGDAPAPKAAPSGAQPLLAGPAPLEIAADEPAPAAAAARYGMTIPDVWLRPYQGMNATTDAPGRIAWYAGVPGAPVKVTLVGGMPYLGRDLLHNRSFGTDPLAPGHAQGLRFHEGRYELTSRRAPLMRATITVAADAPPDDAPRVFLVGDAGDYRFVPATLTVPPDALVAFVNKANATLDVVEREYLARLPGEDARMEMHPVELGVYDLVAVAQDGGEARGRILVDFDRPATHVDLPVLEGEFLNVPLDQARSVAYNASLPIRAIALQARVSPQSTDAAQPGSMRVELRHAGKLLLDALVEGNRTFELRDLPAGEVALTVRPAAGLWIPYRVSGAIDMALPVPDALR